jgi:sugar phosphate isomerase/epimerase
MTDALPPISVQLYSLREEAARDFPSVLRRLGDTGFLGVELAGLPGLAPAEFCSIIDDAGLSVSSGHIGGSPDVMLSSLDDFEAIGCTTAILAYLPPENFATLDAVKASAEFINRAHETAAARNISMGYHNHWWEFETVLDGRSAWSHLWDHLEAGVVAELDLYWCLVGGGEPRKVIRELGNRLALLPVKDGPANDPKASMVSVGSGSVAIADILGAAPTARWHVVELDRCDTDMATAVDDSYRFLTSNNLSRGGK